MKNKTTDVHQVNDGCFHKIFTTPKNTRDFLERVLPTGLIKQLDFSKIEAEDTKYVSNKFEKGFSDIVVKTSLKTKTGKKVKGKDKGKGKKKQVDIYFLLEHKTEGRAEIFIQVLKYMVFEWEKILITTNHRELSFPRCFTMVRMSGRYPGHLRTNSMWMVRLCKP